MEPEEPLNPNPIVDAAMRIRARRDVGMAIDSAMSGSAKHRYEDAEEALSAFAEHLALGIRRLNSILGKNGVKFIRMEKPLRIRLRFGDQRLSMDLDEVQQLVKITGLGLEGEYTFDADAELPALTNLSKISTEAGYGEALTPTQVLKTIAKDAELPRPAHLDGPGPIPL
ncbi:MAG: hypothetical protein M3N19_09075 [Candidatus Eremiobacteraeota bacterium]|nr:hypothetical protein [Candidatus Eremiobacteraeota bacterium]